MTTISRVGEYYQRRIDAETPEQTIERIQSVSDKVRKPISAMSVIRYIKRSMGDLVLNDGKYFEPTQPDELLEYLFDNSLSHTIVDVREYTWARNGIEVVLAESLDGTTNITPEVIEELTIALRRVF